MPGRRRTHRLRHCLWALALLLGGCGLLPAAPTAIDPATVEAIEATQASVRSSAVWVARGVDSWFGDAPFQEEGAVRDGRVSLKLRQRQGEDFKVDLRFNARFSLPNLDALGYFFVGRDDPREIVTDTPGELTASDQLAPAPDQPRSFFAGFGREITRWVDFRVGFRGGLNPYAQARYRRSWQLGPLDSAEFRQTLFWSADDRLGTTSAVSVEHRWSPVLIARGVAAATITQEEPDLGWGSRLGVHRGFGTDRWLALEAFIAGRRGTGVTVGDYGLQARWEQPVYEDQLYGELSVGHFWPREEAELPRGRAWAVGVGLKLRF